MRFLARNITADERLLFTKHLSTLVRGGVPVDEAIRSLAETAGSARLRRILLSMVGDIENGQALSAACARFPRAFDPFYRSIVEVGERSGTLEKNLGFLAESLEKRRLLRRKVAGFLLYPGFVLLSAVIVGGFVSFFVLPKLIPLFSSFEADLPAATRALLFFAELMREDSMLIAAVFAAVLFVFPILVSLPPVRPFWHRILLSFPFLGSFFRSTALSGFCRDLSLMLGSGIPLSTALSIERGILGNAVFRGYAERLESAVLRGRTLESELLSDGYRHIPSLAGRMIGAGERTGRLDESFRGLAEFFESETDIAAKNFATALEPLLILLVGGLVAFVALAIITPLYTLTGSVHR